MCIIDRSNIIASQVDCHALYGGVVPEIASRAHLEAISYVFDEAVSSIGGIKNIDAVAVTYAPGLIGALLVGVNLAKSLAFSINKPLIGVHHLRGHVASNYLTYKNLEPELDVYKRQWIAFSFSIIRRNHFHRLAQRSFSAHANRKFRRTCTRIFK